MPENTPNERKIFPRNLTARAATRVRGNPANARPESGVDNTHPGLEFDQRNLDKAFFPGLVFEFQFLLGAKLVEVIPSLLPPGTDLGQADVDRGVYLWYIYGAFGAAPDTRRLVDLFGLDGYEVLRTIRDLEPGPLVLIVGQPPDPADHGQLRTWLENGLDFADLIGKLAAGVSQTPSRTLRDGDKFLACVLTGDRANYLDLNGVIPREIVPAGGLTRSLCAPWQWDFADCGCHYWAASKPDLVIADESRPLNFQRDRKADPPTGTVNWTTNLMSAQQLLTRWDELPVVIGEQEADKAVSPVWPTVHDPWSRGRIVQELTYLARVEHALCIDYLYAHYSLDAPQRLEPAARPTPVFQAAQEVLNVAIDEMRHFRSVNEALMLLGAPVSLGRAKQIGRGERQVQGSFELLPLTPDRLDFFIEVEAPSRNINHQNNIDGLYTHILVSIRQSSNEYDPIIKQQLCEIIKLLIDEGEDHFRRFTAVRLLLTSQKDYLRLQGPPRRARGENAKLQVLANSYYHTLLNGLGLAFSMGETTRDGLLKQARRSMYSLHDVGHLLASRGVGLLFDMPYHPPARAAKLRGRVDRLRANSGKLLHKLQSSPEPEIQGLAAKHAQIMHELIAGTHVSMGRSAR